MISIIDYLKSHYVLVIVLLYIVFMMLNGHRKGFLRIAVSTLAIFLTFALSSYFLPKLTSYVKNNTSVTRGIEELMLSNIEFNEAYMDKVYSSNDNSRIDTNIADNLNGISIPQSMKKDLNRFFMNFLKDKENDTNIEENILSYLSSKILVILCFVILFIVIWLLIRILMQVLDIVTKVPVINGINKIMGALLGLFNALVILWVASYFIVAISGTGIGQSIVAQINNSIILKNIFSFNLLSFVLKFLI